MTEYSDRLCEATSTGYEDGYAAAYEEAAAELTALVDRLESIDIGPLHDACRQQLIPKWKKRVNAR